MKKKKSKLWFYIVLVAAALGIAGLVKHFRIPKFSVVHEDALYVCAQPRGMDYMRLLYKYHIGMIINIRETSEHREQNWYNEEITWVRNNGIAYTELPIDKKAALPDAAAQMKFLELMADKRNLPVLLHGSGNMARTAVLAAVWLVKGEGLSGEEAVAKAQEINEGPFTAEQATFIRSLKR